MIDRPIGFLAEDQIDHSSHAFQYIAELHSYLWRFCRAVIPSASGDLGKVVDVCLAEAERLGRLRG